MNATRDHLYGKIQAKWSGKKREEGRRRGGVGRGRKGNFILQLGFSSLDDASG